MNTARGFLAEYLVTRAVGSRSVTRIEWDGHDVDGPEGSRLEVKAAGRLQSWAQSGPSTPNYRFPSVRAKSVWNPKIGRERPVEPEERVDAWVFALQTCVDPEIYDPLDISQWVFRVVPHRTLFRSGQVTAGLTFFDRLGVEAVDFDGLADAIATAVRANAALAST